ncbi:hypothetical protein VTN00DRAFT_3279 [Thermoascus crustaceus]|uniref:uncharacterized protein n=1 Tax=Thermoascus crustaceus TaxID=5088 RepID=UPI00374394C0
MSLRTATTLTTILAALPALSTALCKGPPVNIPTLDLIKSFEKMVPDVYDDGAGNPTIGYGHLCVDWECSDVPFPKPLSEPDASNLLAGDLVRFQDALTNALADPVTLNDNQYGALVSWTFNIGEGHMRSSDLVRDMNAGQHPVDVANRELPLWVNAGGQRMEGLVRRRQAELDLFNRPSGVPALPVPC